MIFHLDSVQRLQWVEPVIHKRQDAGVITVLRIVHDIANSLDDIRGKTAAHHCNGILRNGLLRPLVIANTVGLNTQ